MSRYIDADAIISFVDAGHLRNPLELAWSDNDVVDMIESRPTIDAVPVVRCRECKYFDGDQCCDKIGILVIDAELFYCANGERKDGEG